MVTETPGARNWVSRTCRAPFDDACAVCRCISQTRASFRADDGSALGLCFALSAHALFVRQRYRRDVTVQHTRVALTEA